jgi:hypothetical protein
VTEVFKECSSFLSPVQNKKPPIPPISEKRETRDKKAEEACKNPEENNQAGKKEGPKIKKGRSEDKKSQHSRGCKARETKKG